MLKLLLTAYVADAIFLPPAIIKALLVLFRR